MSPTPWSLGFVLATILGALLVPGCRPQDDPVGPSELQQVEKRVDRRLELLVQRNTK